MINLCCIVTNEPSNWLYKMLESADAGTCPPDFVRLYLGEQGEAWAMNQIFHEVPATRVLVHPDAVFGPESIERILQASGDFRIDDTMGCVIYSDACKTVGPWDEAMSPGFYKYVDVDYEWRLAQIGIFPTIVRAGITHTSNGSWRALQTDEERQLHALREATARMNFLAKWGWLPQSSNTIERAEEFKRRLGTKGT